MSNVLTEQQVEQFKLYNRWRNDPILFAEECLKLPTAGGDKLVKFYEPQKRVINSFMKDHFLVLLKSRQTGFSTLSQILCAYITIFFSNVKIGVLSRKGPEASDFVRKTKDMIEKIPSKYSWLISKRNNSIYDFDNAQSFQLWNGSALYAEAISRSNPSSAFRGKSLSLLVVDEAAHAEKIQDAFTGVSPTLSITQKIAEQQKIPFGIIILSTPNKTTGIGEFFYKRWMSALAGAEDEDNVWKAHRIHWAEIPALANDPKWYKNMCSLLGNDELIAQELELEFISSGSNIFKAEIQKKLNKIKSENKKEITHINRFTGKTDGKTWLFEDIKPNMFYFIGVDTATNCGKDYSTIQVFEYDTMNQILESKIKCEPKIFAEYVKTISDMFLNNLIIVERTGGFGVTVLNELMFDENKTYNLYNEVKRSNIKYNEMGKENDIVYGLSTDQLSRPLIIEAMYNFVVNQTDCIKSERLALELLALSYKGPNHKVQADSGFNDDLVMSLAIICYVRQYGVDKYSGHLTEEIRAAKSIKDETPERLLINQKLNDEFKTNTVKMVDKVINEDEEKEEDSLEEFIINSNLGNYDKRDYNKPGDILKEVMDKYNRDKLKKKIYSKKDDEEIDFSEEFMNSGIFNMD